MSFFNVIIYVAVLIAIVFKRVQGRAVGTPRQHFLLPILITVLGFESFSHAHPGTIDLAVGVAGAGLSLALGAFRGTRNRISVRDGAPWVQWGAASVAVLAVNIVAKLALDLSGIAVGGSASGATSSLMLAAGLMLLGEAAVVWLRIEEDVRPAAGRPVPVERG